MNRIFKESFSALLPNNKLLLLFGPKGLDNLNFVTEILSEKSANFNVIDLRLQNLIDRSLGGNGGVLPFLLSQTVL